MTKLVIELDQRDSAKPFLSLAKKLHFPARILSKESSENIFLMKLMREGKKSGKANTDKVKKKLGLK